MQPGAERPFHRARLRYDAAFRTEVGYCYERGIPHSRFLEEWTPEDRAKMVAWAMEAAGRCASCGTSSWEWEEDRFAYVAVREVCQGCAQKELIRDPDGPPDPPGTSVVLIPKEQGERLLAEQERRAKR